MRRRVLHAKNAILCHLAVPALVVLLGLGSAFAQSGDTHAQDQSGKPGAPNSADAAKDNQRKTDEFAEAAQVINGPAGNPECVWLGRRVVRLMWVDDLDTAFRCLTRFGAQIDDKVPKSLSDRVHACWINPSAQPQAAAAAPAPTTSGSAAPPPSASPQPATSPQPQAK